MPIYNIYSKRKKQQENGGSPDIYKYDEIPEALRNQIIHIWRTAIGTWLKEPYDNSEKPPDRIWIAICDILCREFGLMSLGEEEEHPFTQCCTFLLNEPNIDNILSLIEVSFWMIENVCSKLEIVEKYRAKILQEPEDAINELNTRFKEYGIGYQYAGSMIIRIDSQYMHTEAVLPAISLLQQPGFEGACEEFLNAHRNYREGENKEAIAAALRAFESTMKSICLLMNWQFPENATVIPLINICIDNGLIPKPLQGHFESLKATLANGLPTVSNKLARHGQGQKIITVPDYYAAYSIHLAATNIVFLVESYMSIKN